KPSYLPVKCNAWLCPALASFPDSIHEVMMADPAHAPRDRPHDGPPVAVLQSVRRNPKTRQRCAHDKLVVRSFDDRKLAIDQAIPDPPNRIRVPHSDILDYFGAFETIASMFVVEQFVSWENVEHEIGRSFESVIRRTGI